MKLLVAGLVDSEANWQVLLSRVSQLQTSKHGPFDALAVIPGSAPLPTALTFPLPVIAQSGKTDALGGGSFDIQFVSEQSATPIHHADVLLSEFLPGSNSGVPNAIKTCQLAEAWALATCPRYHFAGGAHNAFQRAPYRNASANGVVITRLIVLCPVGSSEKWIHALNLPPAALSAATATVAEPAGTTDCPYVRPSPATTAATTTTTIPRIRALQGLDTMPKQQFFFSPPAVAAALASSSSSSSLAADHNKRARVTAGDSNKPARAPSRLDCWFCLASASCEKHLIVHVEEECYLAMPRGGLQLEHVLLVPIAHQATMRDFLQNHRAECVRLIARVQQLFARQGFGILLTERSLVYGKAAQQHAYLELLPVPLAQLAQAQQVFQQLAAEGNIPFQPLAAASPLDVDGQLELLSKQESEYLFVSLPTGEAFLHVKSADEDLDNAPLRAAKLQFGRALGVALGALPKEHIHWKACVKPKIDEAVLSKQFGKLWKEIVAEEQQPK